MCLVVARNSQNSLSLSLFPLPDHHRTLSCPGCKMNGFPLGGRLHLGDHMVLGRKGPESNGMESMMTGDHPLLQPSSAFSAIVIYGVILHHFRR